MGIDCCGVCAKPESEMGGGGGGDGGDDGGAAVECDVCKAVVYCCVAHRDADAEAHARVCRLLAFSADLDEVDDDDDDDDDDDANDDADGIVESDASLARLVSNHSHTHTRTHTPTRESRRFKQLVRM